MQYLSSQDWQEFQNAFPSAMSFLGKRNLLGETGPS